MSDAGARIIKGLEDAIAGNFARVTIAGQTWVRADTIEANIEDLRKQLVDFERIKEERDDYDTLFEMQWKADQRAIARWQEAHPSQSHIWPDRADMVGWLIQKVEELEAKTVEQPDGPE